MKFLSEIIKGSWLIKIYQKEEEELKKISMIIDERFKAIRKVEQTRLGAGPIMEVISAIAIAIVVFFAGYRSYARSNNAWRICLFSCCLNVGVSTRKSIGWY